MWIKCLERTTFFFLELGRSKFVQRFYLRAENILSLRTVIFLEIHLIRLQF
jgi:hypothetical protein